MTTSMSAADAAALFDGARLTLARQLAGKRKSDLAGMIRKSPTAVAAWETGAKRPTATTVAELSLGLSVDPAFFAITHEDVSSLTSPPHFRSLRATSQLARDQAQAYGQLAVDIATGLERHVEFPEVDLPRMAADVESITDGVPEEAARTVRERWGIGSGPLGHLVRLIENHGVLVVFSPPQAATVDAYSFDSRLRPVVVLNPLKRDYYRQRFDVAHELGHLVMHADGEPGGRIVESQAHRFAGELLMPAGEIAPLLPRAINSSSWTSLARLKEQWGVSMQALLFRARELGVLGDVSYRNAMTTVSARGWRRAEPGQIQVLEQPSLLPRALDLLEGEDVDAGLLAAQCRVPMELFSAAASRTPLAAPSGQVRDIEQGRRRVVSLLRSVEPDAKSDV